MKHNYHIKVDPQLPTDEQIAKHKDFNHVLQEYQKFTQPIYRRPLYKNPKTFLGLFMIATIAYLVFRAVDEEKKSPDPENPNARVEIPAEIVQAEERSFLQPPSSTLKNPSASFSFDPRQPKMIDLHEDAKVKVAAGTFEHQDGKSDLKIANIDVLFCNDPVDMALSGIPSFSPDGQVMEILRVFEIKATEGTAPLRLKAGKEIEILLPGVPQKTGLQLAKLNPQTRRWEPIAGSETSVKSFEERKSKLKGKDGFGVVEYGTDGKVKEKLSEVQEDGSTRMVSVSLDQTGMFALITGENASFSHELPVRLFAGKEPLKLKTVFSINSANSTSPTFWPVSSDYRYMLRWADGRSTIFYGFLSDGRLAWVNSSKLDKVKATDEAGVAVEVQLSEKPVVSKMELMQLLGI